MGLRLRSMNGKVESLRWGNLFCGLDAKSKLLNLSIARTPLGGGARIRDPYRIIFISQS